MILILIILLPLSALIIATSYLAFYFNDRNGWYMWKSWMAAISLVITLCALGWIIAGDSIKDRLSHPGSIEVKYRDGKVPVGGDRFEELGLIIDSTVNNAWYDSGEMYLIIRLNKTNYHYCEVPKGVWLGLKSTRNPYEYYIDTLRENYDCRINHLPAY